LLGAIGQPRDPEQSENGSMFFTREGASIWPHSKVRVVPFGEVLPFRRAISILDYPWGDKDLTEGRFIDPLSWKSHRLGLLICFDNVFGFLSRAEALHGADSFVLMTNNSWYKLSSGVRQHADIDILRAVENRRWLARVSTTGESHLIDSAGRVQQSSRQRSAAVISGRLESSQERTVYHRVGDLFAQLCLLGTVLLCLPPITARRGEGML
jgi:apolipoprotein N-acyltransferase